MILAGIDEAGYGPVLGPLVVGCCAFEIPGQIDAPLPCLWKRLHAVVGKKRSRNGKKLHINDSKEVYSPSAGVKELEKSILALIAASGSWCDNLDALLDRVAPTTRDFLGNYPWYSAGDECFPLEVNDTLTRLMSNALHVEMNDSGTHCVHLAAKVLLEGEFNRMVANTRNKASALFSVAASHIDHLLNHFTSGGLVLLCDRQGGREHYGSLLRTMFEDWQLQIVSETTGRSEYRLMRNNSVARIIFTEKAEQQSLPVAAASMLCKYLREALMRRFNAYWRKHLPELTPTAGYYTDGMRFLADIQVKRKELGIRDDLLIRSR